MTDRDVAFSPEARDDLISIYDWVAEQAGAMVAIGYIGRLEAFCLKLAIAAACAMTSATGCV